MLPAINPATPDKTHTQAEPIRVDQDSRNSVPASPAGHSGVGALPGLGIISSELGSKHAPPPSMPACTEPHSLWAAVGAHPLVLGHPGVLQGNHFAILTLTLKDASER